MRCFKMNWNYLWCSLVTQAIIPREQKIGRKWKHCWEKNNSCLVRSVNTKRTLKELKLESRRYCIVSLVFPILENVWHLSLCFKENIRKMKILSDVYFMDISLISTSLMKTFFVDLYWFLDYTIFFRFIMSFSKSNSNVPLITPVK